VTPLPTPTSVATGLQLEEPPMVASQNVTSIKNKPVPTKKHKNSGKQNESQNSKNQENVLKHVQSKKELIEEVNESDIQSDQTPDEGSFVSHQKNLNQLDKKPQQNFADTKAVKLYNRQESQASVASEPNQQNRNSNVQSNNSWVDNDEAEESFHPKSDYTDDKYENSENKNADNGSDDHSHNSQSADSNKSDQNVDESYKYEHQLVRNQNTYGSNY
jgi:hypothetical protein